jgi:RimJ/RimL family protein N-acetyltransferase
MFKPTTITLNTNKVTLRPLTMEHLTDFFSAGSFPEIWTWSLPDKCTSIEATQDWLAYSEQMANKGAHVPFAIFDNDSGKFVGSTRYCSIKNEDRGLEIGFTFITPQFQRSYINTHAKYCLLAHAFEKLGAIRVEFKTHEKNEKSRNAIARLGAKFEGVLRNQRILSDGSYRNAAIFSIIDSEWPAVKQSLQEKMDLTYD